MVNKRKINKNQFIFIAGPCVIESEKQTMKIAESLLAITHKYPVNFIFKASYDKANRTSLNSYRGPGMKKGLAILQKVKKEFKCPIITDVHCVKQVKPVAEVVDILQIPAFLSRQTDLLVAAAKTQRGINIKKAQFMAPEDISYVIEKITYTGNKKIFITERGVSFGYNNLIVDFRSFSILSQFGYPVVFDVTHSLQKPSANSGVSGGDSHYVPAMSRAAVAFGVDGLFMEVHPNPKEALSDSSTSYPLEKVEKVLQQVLAIKSLFLIKENNEK